MTREREEITKEEAIKRLKEAKSTIQPYLYVDKAIDYAVEFMEQESVLDKVRNEIAEYGSIWVAYAITGHSDRDIENLIEGVLKQAKEQVLNIIDKYKLESEVTK